MKNHKVLIEFNDPAQIGDVVSFKSVEGLIRILKDVYQQELENEVEQFEEDPTGYFLYHTLLKELKGYSFETIENQIIVFPKEGKAGFIVKNFK